MGQPVHVYECVLSLRKGDKLPVTETLMGTLAHCHISHDGLNQEKCDRESDMPMQMPQSARPQARSFVRAKEFETDRSPDEASYVTLFDSIPGKWVAVIRWRWSMGPEESVMCKTCYRKIGGSVRFFAASRRCRGYSRTQWTLIKYMLSPV